MDQWNAVWDLRLGNDEPVDIAIGDRTRLALQHRAFFEKYRANAAPVWTGHRVDH